MGQYVAGLIISFWSLRPFGDSLFPSLFLVCRRYRTEEIEEDEKS